MNINFFPIKILIAYDLSLLFFYYKDINIFFQIEQLYIEVLYTIANTVGASTGQYAHYKEDLYRYAQEAFGVPPDQHRRYLNIASEEKVYRSIDFLLKSVSFLIAKNILLKYYYWRYNNTRAKLNFIVTATYRCAKRGSNRSRWT